MNTCFLLFCFFEGGLKVLVMLLKKYSSSVICQWRDCLLFS